MKITLIKNKGTLSPYSYEDIEIIENLAEGATYQVEIKMMDIRSIKQNSALHKWCDLISTHLNDSGLYINTVLKAETVWSMEKVKENIFKPVVASLYDKKSTTKLNKDEFEKIIDTITLAFANKGIVVPSFPNKEIL